MARDFWNGSGEAEDKVYWTKNDGMIVGRPYVRERARRALSKWHPYKQTEHRNKVLAATVDNDQWLGFRAHETVGSVVRDVEDYLLSHWVEV